MSKILILRIFCSVFLASGVYMLYSSVSEYFENSAFLEKSWRNEGRVIEMVEVESNTGSRRYVYLPKVEYVDRNGEKRIFTSESGSNPPEYDVGDVVEVIFPESQPEDARINSFFSFWFGPVIMAVFGGLFSLVGGGMLWSSRNRHAHAAG